MEESPQGMLEEEEAVCTGMWTSLGGGGVTDQAGMMCSSSWTAKVTERCLGGGMISRTGSKRTRFGASSTKFNKVKPKAGFVVVVQVTATGRDKKSFPVSKETSIQLNEIL